MSTYPVLGSKTVRTIARNNLWYKEGISKKLTSDRSLDSMQTYYFYVAASYVAASIPGQAQENAYPMSYSIALVIICLLIVAILWLPGILGKD